MEDFKAMIAEAKNAVAQEHGFTADIVEDSHKYQRMIDDAQLSTAEELKRMREQMEASNKEQDKQNKKAMRVSISALVVGILTLIATILFGALQVLH